jgi:glycosyltransferase involved in cell wall biosynthesis
VSKCPTVLMSAYACRPNHGSEQAVGWEWLTAAAVNAHVFLLTRERNSEAIRRALPESLVGNIDFCPVELGRTFRWMKKKLPMGTHVYYLLWQFKAYFVARELIKAQSFDVIHHVTFATDWQFASAMMLKSRAVKIWGPVGGASFTPRKLLSYLGPRGALSDLLRWTCSGLLRACFAAVQASRADIVLAQNNDVKNWLAKQGRNFEVRPNAAISETGSPLGTARNRRRLIFAGRLIPWKGAALAIDVMARLDQGWHLDIYGEGPDLQRLQRRVASYRLEDRVRFLGRVSRKDLLEEFRNASAFLFPSLHDSGPWVVAEAASQGLKTVCLDLAGTALLATSTGGRAVSHREPDVIGALAQAVQDLSGEALPDVWSRSVLEGFLKDLYSSSADEIRLSRQGGK